MTQLPDSIVGCGAVNDHIGKAIPSTLWHYTSFRGLQGIVSSASIWATEHRFLNDREEFLHAKRLAEELVDEEPEFIGNRYPARDILRKSVGAALNSGHLHEERLRVMVASLAEEGDQLSQWRGYADDSRGVSIGLDMRHLRPPAGAGTAVTFAPCLYKDEDKRRLLKAVFAHHRKGLQAWWDSVVERARRRGGKGPVELKAAHSLVAEHMPELNRVLIDAEATLRYDLLRISPLLKNESFSEEREWRLVLPLERIHLPMVHEVQFRYTRESLVPYIAFPLRLPNQDGPIACKGVILGPGSHPSAAVGVNMFLQTQQIPVFAIPSKIPYRPM